MEPIRFIKAKKNQVLHLDEVLKFKAKVGVIEFVYEEGLDVKGKLKILLQDP